MYKKTIKQLILDLSKKRYSVVELVQAYLTQIKKSKLNAFTTITEKSALTEAQKADATNKINKYTKIIGIPFAHKDVFCTKNIRTTCATKMLKNFVPQYDSTIHKKLKKNGFILLGKTNMDEFCMGSNGEHSIFGSVLNPLNHSRTPGGSSSGSAASVAANLVPFATGSDTGGSVRQPASFCGIVGLKPTYGRISRYGLVQYASSLDHCGILAKTVEDCGIVLNVIAGYDENDLTSIKDKSNFLSTLTQPLHGTVVGIPKELFEETIEKEIFSAWVTTIEKLRFLGAKIVFVKLCKTNLYTAVYRAIATVECLSNLARYDSIQYGNNIASIQTHKQYNDIRTRYFGLEVKKRIILGNYLALNYNNNNIYNNAKKLRIYITENYKKTFKNVHAILHPTTPTTAFLLGNKSELTQIKTDKYTCAANLTGMPAITIPVHLTKQNMPVSMQLMSNVYQEKVILNIAHLLQTMVN